MLYIEEEDLYTSSQEKEWMKVNYPQPKIALDKLSRSINNIKMPPPRMRRRWTRKKWSEFIQKNVFKIKIILNNIIQLQEDKL